MANSLCLTLQSTLNHRAEQIAGATRRGGCGSALSGQSCCGLAGEDLRQWKYEIMPPNLYLRCRRTRPSRWSSNPRVPWAGSLSLARWTEPRTMIARICFVLVWLTFCAPAAPSWPRVSFSEVRGYSYNTKGYGPQPIIKDGKLNATVINTNGAVLVTNQVRHLLAAITGEHSPHLVAACFNPRHAFVFYDSDKKAVAQAEVCFECVQGGARPDGAAVFFDWCALADLCRELKLPNSPDPDFCKRFNAMKTR